MSLLSGATVRYFGLAAGRERALIEMREVRTIPVRASVVAHFSSPIRCVFALVTELRCKVPGMGICRRAVDWLSGIGRHFRWWWQRRTWGWDERDVWSLDVTIAKFVLPRLRLLRETLHGYPPCCITGDGVHDPGNCNGDGFASFEEWQAAVDKMIAAFDYTAHRMFDDTGEHQTHAEGLALFAKYYWSLWD